MSEWRRRSHFFLFPFFFFLLFFDFLRPPGMTGLIAGGLVGDGFGCAAVSVVAGAGLLRGRRGGCFWMCEVDGLERVRLGGLF